MPRELVDRHGVRAAFLLWRWGCSHWVIAVVAGIAVVVVPLVLAFDSVLESVIAMIHVSFMFHV